MIHFEQLRGFPVGTSGKEFCWCRRHKRHGFYPRLGRSPGVGSGVSLQDSCLENSLDRGAWTTVQEAAKSRTWLSTEEPREPLSSTSCLPKRSSCRHASDQKACRPDSVSALVTWRHWTKISCYTPSGSLMVPALEFMPHLTILLFLTLVSIYSHSPITEHCSAFRTCPWRRQMSPARLQPGRGDVFLIIAGFWRWYMLWNKCRWRSVAQPGTLERAF